ncbi:hypothetical protein CD790_18985 [Streptomyces sp. SAJ15]|nr:hypothetical protein CD790_18985 [Streptomyces sp. SAJ15]
MVVAEGADVRAAGPGQARDVGEGDGPGSAGRGRRHYHASLVAMADEIGTPRSVQRLDELLVD